MFQSECYTSIRSASDQIIPPDRRDNKQIKEGATKPRHRVEGPTTGGPPPPHNPMSIGKTEFFSQPVSEF
jgi:hypothetical protein